MNTIKIFLAESGRVAELKKDFPLYQGQFQNKLLNVYVPTSILAPSFVSKNENGVVLADYVASTSVKMGMTYTARDGSIKVSKNYYMRYLKTLTYQNVEYAMYERKLPQEFTFYAGQGANAPILIINAINILDENQDGTPAIISVLTSQTCALDVMPSTNLDQDESIEPSEWELVNGQINEINEILPTKQDKIDDGLQTTDKSVVGAINENKGRVDTNTENIELNRQEIAQNRNDIDFLRENMQMSEDYIGQITTDTMPTDTQLTNYVIGKTDPSREPKNGDVIIVVLKIEDETDRNFKYFYSGSGWQYYEIPPLQEAKNGVSGIIKGTYAVGSTADTLVDISGGEILNIYVKDNDGTYRNIVEYLNTTTTNIGNIINGTTSVGIALRAINDGLGNNIVNTYLTKALGVTQQQMRDYAMPRVFNDVDFISADGYVDNVPTTPESGVQFTTNTSAVGDFQLFQIEKTNTAEFELSSKNGYSNNIYISASAVCTVTFRLTTQYKKTGEDWADLNVELTSPITMSAGDIQKIMFSNPFSYLGDNVISLTNGDMIRQTLDVITQTSTPLTFDVYSNDVYPSIFNLTSQSYTLAEIEEDIGKHIQLGLDGVIEAGRVVFTVKDVDSFIEYRTHLREFFITAYLPVVVPTFQSLDPTMPVAITFGDTTYNLYNYMLGANAPLTIGNLMSVASYDPNTGFFFNFKATFFETSDLVGFFIIPPAIIATQLDDIIQDNDTVVSDLTPDGTKLIIHLSASVVNKLAKVLVTPMSAPPSAELVGIGTDNTQKMIDLGNGMSIENNTLQLTPEAPFVSYTDNQTLTEAQKAQARSNIGAGSGSFTGQYGDLQGKPTLNSTNVESLPTSANETIDGQINVHKVAKTGALADTVQDADYQTISAAQKEQITQNQADISDLQSDVQAIEEDYLSKKGGTVDGDISVNGSVIAENVNTSAMKLAGNVTNEEQNYVLVTDTAGNTYKRAMNKMLDDIGGSTILVDGIRQDTFEMNDKADQSALEQTASNLQANINAEVNARTSADTNLQTQITENHDDIATHTQQITNLNNTTVRISGDQEIGGKKNFGGTFQINGGTISYDPSTQTFTI